MKTRYLVLIDGFNFYHRIDNHFKSTKENLKWLDYKALALSLISEEAELVEIIFFTALPIHKKNPKKLHRHNQYIKALESTGVNVIVGNFKKKDIELHLRNNEQPYPFKVDINAITYEEKETDVNLAITLIDRAYQDTFDKCLLFSVDTDLTPSLKLVKKRFDKKKEVIIIAPPGKSKYEALKSIFEKFYELKPQHFRKNQLPDEISTKSGETIKNPYLQ